MKLIDTKQVGSLEALLESLKGDFDIFWDVPYQEPEPTTEEEIESAHIEALIDNEWWNETEAQWKANNYKCTCGRPMHLVSAFYDGICYACVNDDMAEIWFAEHQQ